MVVRNFMLLALVAACAPAWADTDPSITDIRSLGAQVAHVADQFEHGTVPSSIEMSNLDHQFAQARASTTAGADQTLFRKFTSIATRFEKLKFDIATSPGPSSNSNSLTRAQIDLESVSEMHGASCANALGITLDRPVRLTLPNSSDAWFFISGIEVANLRFHTISAGPDPALEVFDGCGAAAKSIVNNDDSMGLDADVGVLNIQQRTLYVHLTNSGLPGPIMLAAAAAPETVNGTVKDVKTNAAIPGVQVALYSSTNPYYSYGYGYTDQNGNYSAAASQPGTFYVVASAQSYVTQLYPTGYCPFGAYFYTQQCDLSTAHTVTVTASGSVSNINFLLSNGQKISGQVRATDNTPLGQSSVSLLMPNGQSITSVNTDTAGHYVFSTLPPDSYVVQADAQGYGSQLYDTVSCAGPAQTQCNALAANVLSVGSQDVADIDFRLPRLSNFFGQVTGSDGQPLPSIALTILDQNGNAIGYGGTDNAGHYSAGSLSAGTYYLYANGYGVFSRLYPSHDCVLACYNELPDGTPFTFTSAGQNVEADFTMDYLPTLSGHISDATTGAPLRNVQVLINTQPPSVSAYSLYGATTDALGNYGVANIQAGTYFVWAQSSDHVDQIYSGVICESLYFYSTVDCDVTGATLLTVNPGQQTVPSFDFALNASSSVSGHAIILPERAATFLRPSSRPFTTLPGLP